jgi:hypothetical protein
MHEPAEGQQRAESREQRAKKIAKQRNRAYGERFALLPVNGGGYRKLKLCIFFQCFYPYLVLIPG